MLKEKEWNSSRVFLVNKIPPMALIGISKIKAIPTIVLLIGTNDEEKAEDERTLLETTIHEHTMMPLHIMDESDLNNRLQIFFKSIDLPGTKFSITENKEASGEHPIIGNSTGTIKLEILEGDLEIALEKIKPKGFSYDDLVKLLCSKVSELTCFPESTIKVESPQALPLEIIARRRFGLIPRPNDETPEIAILRKSGLPETRNGSTSKDNSKRHTSNGADLNGKHKVTGPTINQIKAEQIKKSIAQSFQHLGISENDLSVYIDNQHIDISLKKKIGLEGLKSIANFIDESVILQLVSVVSKEDEYKVYFTSAQGKDSEGKSKAGKELHVKKLPKDTEENPVSKNGSSKMPQQKVIKTKPVDDKPDIASIIASLSDDEDDDYKPDDYSTRLNRGFNAYSNS